MAKTSRKEREKDLRLNGIIDAAERIFAAKGFDYATMDEIAREAEFTKRTVYGYFPGKADIFAAVTSRALSVLVGMFKDAAASGETGFERVSGIGRAYVSFFENYPDYFRILSCKANCVTASGTFADEVRRLDEEMFGIITRSFEEGRVDGTIRKDIEPKIAALHVVSVSNGLLEMVSRFGGRIEKDFGISATDFIEYSMNLIGDSIRYTKKGESK
ncbi:MAG TPA: TetR/AcrR family transcriptional regulator [Spirochaetota bacterium]|nr:TetR/AcrR family transcriptional regulator [Spirochaetota bacterium]